MTEWHPLGWDEKTGKFKRKSVRPDITRMVPKDKWDAKWVGVVPSYPKTEEAFERRKEVGRATFAKLRAEGRPPTRKGVPNGWGERKDDLKLHRLRARRMAKKEMAQHVADGTVDETLANGALLAVAEILHNPTTVTSDRLKAAKILADALKARPTQRIETTVSPAEAWLNSLSSKED